jgi:20S proteasome alpha/beta subunit
MLTPRRGNPPRKRRRTLTVCVAAMAAESEALVLISDKAVTRGIMVSDTTICKMSQIADSPWHALISGDISVCDEILQRSEEALAKAKSDANSYVSMMRLVGRAYADTYEAHLIAQTLTPKLLKKDDLVNRPRRLLPLRIACKTK